MWGSEMDWTGSENGSVADSREHGKEHLNSDKGRRIVLIGQSSAHVAMLIATLQALRQVSADFNGCGHFILQLIF